MKVVNKRIVITLLITTVIIVFLGVFLFQKNYNNKEVKLDNVKLNTIDKDNDAFAIMVETDNGYEPYTGDAWPTTGYRYNVEKSGCVDKNGKTVDAITYTNNKLAVKTNSSMQCYLYFDSYLECTSILYNMIKNGGFENGATNWSLSDAEVVSTEKNSGSYSLQLNPNVLSMSQQTLDATSPTLNHKYYGRLMFKSSESYSNADNRFEWYTTDAGNGLMVFANKNLATTTWQLMSNIGVITTSDYLSNSWYIRNFTVNGTTASWVDDLVIINLTETFGEGKEPTKEWLDAHIKYFDGATAITYNAKESGAPKLEECTAVKLPMVVSLKVTETTYDKISVSASGLDDGTIATYHYSIDNGSYVSSTSNTYTFSGLTAGSHTISVYVTDTEGNTSDTMTKSQFVSNFDITATGYRTLAVNNIVTDASSYTLKYASGNQEDSYFTSSGTSISSGTNTSSLGDGIYTFALLDSSGKVIVTKKVAHYYFTSSTTRSRSATLTVSGVTEMVGSPMVDTGSVTATLSGTSIKFSVSGGTRHKRDCECPDGGSVSGTTCTGSTYTITTTRTYTCNCGGASNTSNCSEKSCSGACDSGCKTGYTKGTATDHGWSPTSSTCTSGTYSATRKWTASCKWDGNYSADCTSYYRYTAAVVVR